MNNSDNSRMILFDLDGTLWDSSRQVAESWNAAMELYAGSYDLKGGIPVFTGEILRSLMGKTMEEIAAASMPEEKPEVRDPLFQKCAEYEVEWLMKSGGNLYPEVRETLEQLRSRGYLLSIVSNCQADYVKAFLISMNMQDLFCDYEEWGRTLRSKGENIRSVIERNQVSEAFYVGDTQKDKDAAVEAGIPFVLAAYGFGEVDSCDGSISAFCELPQAAEQFFRS